MDMESVELMPYLDQAEKLTLGVGHLLTQTELASGQIYLDGKFTDWKNGLTREQVMALLAQDLRATETVVNAHVRVPLEQYQFDALCAFCFNVGAGAFVNSTLLKRLNEGRYEAVPEQMRKWVYVTKGGQKVVSKGLKNRRDAEIKLWGGDNDQP